MNILCSGYPLYTYPQYSQRKKKEAKKKENSTTAGLLWLDFFHEAFKVSVRFIREALG